MILQSDSDGRAIFRFRSTWGPIVRSFFGATAKSLTLDTVVIDSLAFSRYSGLPPLLRFWIVGEADQTKCLAEGHNADLRYHRDRQLGLLPLLRVTSATGFGVWGRLMAESQIADLGYRRD